MTEQLHLSNMGFSVHYYRDQLKHSHWGNGSESTYSVDCALFLYLMYCITDQYLALASVTGQFGQVNLTTFQANSIENSLGNTLYLYLDLALEVPHMISPP